MTAPVQDEESTAGWLACHNRARGCEWLAVYSDLADEPAARRIQAKHHKYCRFGLPPAEPHTHPFWSWRP